MSRTFLFFAIALLTVTLGGACGEADSSNHADADAGTEAPDSGSGDGDGDAGTEEPVLRFGLEGFCDHYKECGGSYDATAQDCIDRSMRYWGDCRRDLLDAWSECMKTIPCEGWNPDAYQPANVGRCEEEWQTLREADSCG